MVVEIAQLPIAGPWGRWTLNMNTIDSLAFMFSLKIGRQCTPLPRNGKVEISGQGDILILADVPHPPRNEKVGFQVKMTFCFWLMYPPPRQNEKVGYRSKWHFGSGWHMPPPPPRNWNWTKHECYRNKNHFKRGHQVHFTTLPPLP